MADDVLACLAGRRRELERSLPVNPRAGFHRTLAMAFDTQSFTREDAIRNAADGDYMNPEQRAYFRRKLLEQRDELLRRQARTRAELVDADTEIDMNDRATREEQAFLTAALRQRDLRELQDIDAALARVASGEYGWCERTGEPIGIARLLARPTARTITRKAGS
jgi:DnaK suppressor protein